MEITADQLDRLALDSEKRGYNRLLVENFHADGDGYEIDPTFAHHFARGEQCESHIRCVITKDKTVVMAFLDVSLFAAEAILGWDSSTLCRELITEGVTDVSDANHRAFKKSLRQNGVAAEKLEAAALSALTAINI